MPRDDYEIDRNQGSYVDNTLWPIISQSFYYHDSRDRFQVLSAWRPRRLNHALRAEYEAIQEKQAATLSPGEKLQEIFLFAKVNKDKVDEICRNGIRRGNVIYSQIGRSKEGVCLVRCADVLDEDQMKDGYQGMVILFKVSVRSLLEVENDVCNDAKMRPTPGFDGHVSWNWSLYEAYQQKPCSSTVGHYKLHYASQYYLYQFESDFRSTVSHPKHIIPYAVINFRYRAVSPTLSITNVGASESQKPKYNLWDGFLNYSQFPDKFLVRLTSHDRSFIPVAFGELSVRPFSLTTVLSECFSNVKADKVLPRTFVTDLRHVYMRMTSVEPVNAFDLMVKSLKSQDSVAVQCLSKSAKLILMPSSRATKNLEIHAPISSLCELHCFIVFDSLESPQSRFNSWISWRWSGNEDDPKPVMDLRSAEWEQFDSGRPVAIPVNELIDIFKASSLSNTAIDISNSASEVDLPENGNETAVSDTSIYIEPEDDPVPIKTDILSINSSELEENHPESSNCDDGNAELFQVAENSSVSSEQPTLMEFCCESQQSIEENIPREAVVVGEAEAVVCGRDFEASLERGSQEATAATPVETGPASTHNATDANTASTNNTSDAIDDASLHVQDEPMDLTLRKEDEHLKTSDEVNVESNQLSDADCVSKPSFPRFLACRFPEPDDEFVQMVCTLPPPAEGKRNEIKTRFYYDGEFTKMDECDVPPIKAIKLIKTPDGKWSNSSTKSKSVDLKRLAVGTVSLIKELSTPSNDNPSVCTTSSVSPSVKKNQQSNSNVKAFKKRRGRPPKMKVDTTTHIRFAVLLDKPQDTVSEPIYPITSPLHSPQTGFTSPLHSPKTGFTSTPLHSPQTGFTSPLDSPIRPLYPIAPLDSPIPTNPITLPDLQMPTTQTQVRPQARTMQSILNNQFVQSPHVSVSTNRHYRPFLPDTQISRHPITPLIDSPIPRPPFTPLDSFIPRYPITPLDSPISRRSITPLDSPILTNPITLPDLQMPTTQTQMRPQARTMQSILNNQFVQSPHVSVSPNRHYRPLLLDPQTPRPPFTPLNSPLPRPPITPLDSSIPRYPITPLDSPISRRSISPLDSPMPRYPITPLDSCIPRRPVSPLDSTIPKDPITPLAPIPTTQIQTRPQGTVQSVLNNQLAQSPHVSVPVNRRYRRRLPKPSITPRAQPFPHQGSSRTNLTQLANYQFGTGYNPNYSRLVSNYCTQPVQHYDSTPFRYPNCSECAGLYQQPQPGISNNLYMGRYPCPSGSWSAQSVSGNSRLPQTSFPYFPPPQPNHFQHTGLYPTIPNQSIGTNNYFNFIGINANVYDVHTAAPNQQTFPYHVPYDISTSIPENIPNIGITGTDSPNCLPQSNSNHDASISCLPGLTDDHSVRDMDIE